MIALLLTVLFASAAVLAVMTIAGGWHRYAGAIKNLRAQLRDCDDLREVSVRTRELRVATSARVLRPDFTTARRRPAAAGLSAAA